MLKPQNRVACAIAVLICGAALAFGQGGTGKLPPPDRNPNGRPPRGYPEGPPQDPYVITINKTALNNGVIAGEISYRGPAPRRMRVDMSADPVCRQLNPRFEIEEPMVRRGKVANVFVYLKDGVTDDRKKLSELSFPVPQTEVMLDQKGCLFLPHILGVTVNQAITITNSDATIHNVHFMPRNNADWNQSQTAGATPLTHRLNRTEVMVPIKDNQHSWKRAYVGVLPHPFFIVTGEDGRFEIRGVPPGKYTLAAWHEGPGNGNEIRIKVTVKSQ